jgi:hypothetical protein
MRKYKLQKLLAVLSVIFALGALFFMSKPALAANPNLINFQGKVVNADGTNVTNGTYSFNFVLFDDPTAGTESDGVHDKWHELAKSVDVTNGTFQTELGSATTLPDFSQFSALYLGVKFNGDSAGYMTPRIHLDSAPYAKYSDNSGALGGLAATNFVQLAQGLQTDSSTTNASIAINKTNSSGAPDILILQKSGQNVLEVNNSGTVLLGQAGASGLNGTLTFNNAAGSHTVSLSLQADPGSSYTLLLPTTGPSTSQCLQTDGTTANQLTFAACATGGSGATSVAYSATANSSGGSITGSVLTLAKADGSNPGLLSADAQTIGGDKTFKSIPNSTTALQIQNAIGSNAFSVDTTPLNTLLVNSSFENTSTTNWVYSGAAGGSAARSTAQAYLGSASLAFTSGTVTTASDGVKYVVGTSLTASTTYNLSFYAMTTTTTALFNNLTVTYSPNGGTTNFTCMSGQTVAFAWGLRFSCSFNSTQTGVNPNTSAYFIIQNGDTTTRTFYIDAVQLEQASSATAYKETGINLQGNVTSNTIFSGLLTLQPAAGLATSQSGVQQTLTSNAVNGGFVTGYNQSITVNNSTFASTTQGINIAITDATTLTNTTNGVNATLTDSGSGVKTNTAIKATDAGSNASQLQYAVDASANHGVAIRGASTGAGGSITCGPTTAADSIGVCGTTTLASSSGFGGYFAATGNGGTALFATNGTSTANIFQLQDGTSVVKNVVTVADEGAATFANRTNSTAAFQVQDNSSAALLTVDTTNSQIITTSLAAQTPGSVLNKTFTSVDTTGIVGQYTSTAIGSDGFARISYYDNPNGDLKFVQCTNTACTTSNITSVDGPANVGLYTSLAIGSDGFARISYFDLTNADLKFVQCTNAACTTHNITSVDTTGNVGSFTSTAIGSDGFARISYEDGTNLDLKFVQCTNAACTTHNITSVDTTGDVGQYSSMAIGSDGFARISYYDATNIDLKFAQCTNAACTTANITSVDTTGSVGAYTSLVIGSDGFARISYYESINGNLKFAQCTNAACSTSNITSVDTTGVVGQYSSIDIGSDGFARISYYDVNNFDLKFAQCTNAACTTANITSVDTTGDVGQHTSIAISSDDTVRISYYDNTNGDLKFAIPVSSALGSSVGTTANPYGQIYAKAIDVGGFSVAADGTSLFKPLTDSISAFQIQNASSVNMLAVDTTGNKIQIGSSISHSSNPIVLVLDDYNNATEPIGSQAINGAMYYNANLNKFRCYENGSWTNCISLGRSLSLSYPDGTLGTSVAWTNMPAAVTEFAGTTTRRMELDLTGLTHWKISMDQSAAAVSGALLGIQYSSDGGTTWKAIDSDTTNAQSTTTDALSTSSSAFTISAQGAIGANAQGIIQIRIVGSAGNGTADPAFLNGHISFYP